MDRIKKSWELFKSLIIQKGLELYPVADTLKSVPKVNEVRELSSNISFYFAIVEEFLNGQNKFFKVIVLSEEILLGYISKKTPILKLPQYRTLLIVLPIWIYLSEEFLTEYTYRRKILKNEESEKFIRYAEEASIPEDLRGEFVKTVMKLLAPYNTSTILESLDAIERIERTSTIIRIPDEIKQYFEKKYRNIP
jgi:hypothetical protein